jgi:hypothetical protein
MPQGGIAVDAHDGGDLAGELRREDQRHLIPGQLAHLVC